MSKQQEDSNIGLGIIMRMKVGGHLTGMGDRYFMTRRNKPRKNQAKRKGSQPLNPQQKKGTVIPLSELRQWHSKAADDENDDDKVSEAELEKLNQVHRKEIARREAEEKKHNQELARKCQEQVSKIQASTSRGGAAPMFALSIKASQKLRVYK